MSTKVQIIFFTTNSVSLDDSAKENARMIVLLMNCVDVVRQLGRKKILLLLKSVDVVIPFGKKVTIFLLNSVDVCDTIWQDDESSSSEQCGRRGIICYEIVAYLYGQLVVISSQVTLRHCWKLDGIRHAPSDRLST